MQADKNCLVDMKIPPKFCDIAASFFKWLYRISFISLNM